MNSIRTSTKLIKTVEYSKKEFEMKNHEFCPTSSQSFLEVNANTRTNNRRNRESNKGHDYYSCSGHRHSGQWNNRNRCHQKWNVYERHSKDNDAERENVIYNNNKKIVIGVKEKILVMYPQYG